MKRIGETHLIDCYGSDYKIAAHVSEGEIFSVQTHNHLADLEAWKEARKDPNPKLPNVTGPIYIEGAKEGFVLRVEILDLKITTTKGIIVALPGKGALKEIVDTLSTKEVQIDDNFIHFSDKIKIYLRPMIGKIGVAPKFDRVPSSLPGPHGGNMDNSQIQKGTSVYLPVFVEGAYLGIGDLHAAMGDGESAHSGVETEGEVILRCSLLREMSLSHPLVITDNEIITTAEGKSLEIACKTALINMHKLISENLHLSKNDACMLISVAADVRICQLVNGLLTVRVAIPRYILPLFPT
jgi:amidase